LFPSGAFATVHALAVPRSLSKYSLLSMQRAQAAGTIPLVRTYAHSAQALAALTLLCLGCRLPGWGGPVSGEVLNCRQLTQRGLSAMDRGQWDEAEIAFSQAVQSCGVDSEARRHYAEMLWRRGARGEAVAQLKEAVRLAGDDPLLVVRLGEMLLADSQLEPALACAQAALDLNPRLASAWVLRAETMRRADQPRQALADYHRALSCDRGNREALLQMAELHRQLNQPQRALVALQCLADTYPLG
jgi:tetratricopeptide (TPR) repeat protein